MKRTLITSVLIFAFLVLGTGVAILYAKGYRIIPQKNGRTILQGTGLVVLTSTPDGAKVYIDGELTTATNNTINLFPNTYSIKVEKDGYIAWQKKVDVQKEVVTQIDALLIPQAPKLESITLTGAKHPIVDPTGSLIAYGVSSGSAIRNGIYVLDMSGNLIIPIGGSSTQISDDSLDMFSQASLTFSPDGKELLATVSAAFSTNKTYRFNASGSQQRATNVSSTLSVINEQWEAGASKLFQERLRSLKKPVNNFVKMYFNDVVFSPEQDKILYMASQSATLPIAIQPRLLGTNNTAERRDIEKGGIYLYDIKEDRNYLISSSSQARQVLDFHWFPDSKHLLFIEDRKIYLSEYDGGNKTIVYAGPFEDGFVAPWPDGSRIVILTNLNSPDIPLNLYTVSLK